MKTQSIFFSIGLVHMLTSNSFANNSDDLSQDPLFKQAPSENIVDRKLPMTVSFQTEKSLEEKAQLAEKELQVLLLETAQERISFLDEKLKFLEEEISREEILENKKRLMKKRLNLLEKKISSQMRITSSLQILARIKRQEINI